MAGLHVHSNIHHLRYARVAQTCVKNGHVTICVSYLGGRGRLRAVCHAASLVDSGEAGEVVPIIWLIKVWGGVQEQAIRKFYGLCGLNHMKLTPDRQ